MRKPLLDCAPQYFRLLTTTWVRGARMSCWTSVPTCAVTGAIHTPSMSPHLPVTPDEIIADALGAAEAGAAILHLHARDPETGKPDQTPEAFARFLQRFVDAGLGVYLASAGSGEGHALTREESCGGHFRVEYQDDEGEAQRDDDNFAHVAAWEWTGDPMSSVRHREELQYEVIHLAKRSYK